MSDRNPITIQVQCDCGLTSSLPMNHDAVPITAARCPGCGNDRLRIMAIDVSVSRLLEMLPEAMRDVLLDPDAWPKQTG